MITSTFQDATIIRTVRQIFVWPQKDGQTNVLGKVVWSIEFERNGATSMGAVETMVDTSDLSSNFVDINSITEEIALEWALDAQGGESFLAQLYQLHLPVLLEREQQVGLVPWDLTSSI